MRRLTLVLAALATRYLPGILGRLNMPIGTDEAELRQYRATSDVAELLRIADFDPGGLQKEADILLAQTHGEPLAKWLPLVRYAKYKGWSKLRGEPLEAMWRRTAAEVLLRAHEDLAAQGVVSPLPDLTGSTWHGPQHDRLTPGYVVVDVEGNGQQPPDLVELAAVPIVGGCVGEPTSWLVRPDQPIKHFASQIHGISNKDVADAPVFADVMDDVLRELRPDALVAHNAHVDLGVLQRKLTEWTPPEVFDTLKLARRLLPEQDSYKLGALVDFFELAVGLPEGLSPHCATYDALVTARLFQRLAGTAGSLEALRGIPPGGGEDESSALF